MNEKFLEGEGKEGLRRTAEARLQAVQTGFKDNEAGLDARKLLYELQVHQIELEMQNENLCQAREETERALRRYTGLYEFAPVGLFTVRDISSAFGGNSASPMLRLLLLRGSRGVPLGSPCRRRSSIHERIAAVNSRHCLSP